MWLKGKRGVGDEILKVGKGWVTKGFVNQVEFGLNFTCNEHLLKCSEERIYTILCTFFK